MALRERSACEAAAVLGGLASGDYRTFNCIIADPYAAWFVRNTGTTITSEKLPAGVSMTTASDPNDMGHKRVARHLPRFQAAPVPNPPDWGSWPTLLADSEGPLEAALSIPPTNGFGTSSAMLLAVAPGERQMLFAPGAPGSAAFTPV